ncbi:MAG: GntR family transcriptional regulator [Gaiellaceae bacterium]
MASATGRIFVSKASPIPLYRQIQRLIIRQIGRGELPIGAKVSEHELARLYDVSRITTRHALIELEREGWVIRVQGKGTFVSERRKLEPLSALTSFSENMRALGKHPSYRTLGLEYVPARGELTQGLDVDAGDAVLRIERLLFADETEMALMRAFLPARVFELDRSLWTKKRLDTTSLYQLLEHELGIQLWKSKETVEATTADDDAALLELEPDDLLLRVQRQTWDRGLRPIEQTWLYYRADLYRYQVELFRAPSH